MVYFLGIVFCLFAIAFGVSLFRRSKVGKGGTNRVRGSCTFKDRNLKRY